MEEWKSGRVEEWKDCLHNHTPVAPLGLKTIYCLFTFLYTYRPSGACYWLYQSGLYTFRLSEALENHISAPAVRKVYRKRGTRTTKHQRCERCIENVPHEQLSTSGAKGA